MNAYQTRAVELFGRPCRVTESGQGRPYYYMPSSVLSLKWTAFHDALAAHGRLLACHLPGFGGNDGQDSIDDHLGWCLAARDLLLGSGFKPGDTLIASSATGAVAADVAALWPDLVQRLVLIAPFGLYDMKEPTRDMFAIQTKEAPGVFCENPEAYARQLEAPPGEEPVSWSIAINRAQEAAARILWPFGDTRLSGRLHRIKASTLLVWGEGDKVVPPAYARKFAAGMTAQVATRMIGGGGHLVELDRPQETAEAVRSFVH
jgi:pimeloyl-ACP methyl ester carboxylesterase